MRYAIVKNGIVTNTTDWDGVTSYTPDGELVSIEDYPEVGINWLFDGTTFTPPPTPSGPATNTMMGTKATATGDGSTTTFVVPYPGVTMDSVVVVSPDPMSYPGYAGAQVSAPGEVSISYSVAPPEDQTLTWNIIIQQ